MKRKKRLAFAVAGITALLLITIGLFMAFRVLERYGQIILDNEDGQLYGLAHSVDRSVSSYIRQFQRDLEYVTQQESVLQAEKEYLEQGQWDGLKTVLQDSILADHPLVHDVVCLQEDDMVFSVQGQENYRFPPGAGTKGELEIGPCLDSHGTVFLSLCTTGTGGIQYAVLVDLSALYQMVAGDIYAGERNHVILMDAGGKMILFHNNGETQVQLLHDQEGTVMDEAALQALLTCIATGERVTVSYMEQPEQGREAYEARMVVVPADQNNGVFVVGISMDYEAVKRPIHMSAFRMTAYCSMVIGGILLLVGLTVYARRRNQRMERELEMLQAQNAQLEEITEKTKTLARHQRLETIGTLTSSIAHEFNNLLTPIMGYAMMAMEHLPPDAGELYDNLLEIYQTSRRAKGMISNLSDLSRKNSPLTMQFVSPDQIVRRVLDMAAPAKPQEVTVASRLLCKQVWVYGNEIQLCQMLLNLVLNAYQAMEDAGGTMKIETCDAGDHVCFCISDTGPGMSEEVKSKMFEPFFSSKEAGKGTGLGLAVVQQIVREHRGDISVHSVLGQGTEIAISIPLVPHERELS